MIAISVVILTIVLVTTSIIRNHEILAYTSSYIIIYLISFVISYQWLT